MTYDRAKQTHTKLVWWWGGDIIVYPDECATPTASLLTVKLLLSSMILTLGANFFT